jgi:quercetin dioxygenase-like cupin family protein
MEVVQARKQTAAALTKEVVMGRRIGSGIAVGVIAVMIGTTVAVATPPSGLSPGAVLGRASWNRQEQKAFIKHLEKLRRLPSSDVAIVGRDSDTAAPGVQAAPLTLAPGGTTGWHTHPGPSVVVLTSGTLKISETRGGCISDVSTVTGPTAFFHSPDVHTFDNPAPAGGAVAEFYITYFVPVGAPLADFSPPAPPACTDDDGDDDEDD